MNSFFPSKTVLLSITSNVRLFGICFLSAKEPHGPFYSELGKSPLLIVDMASEIKDNLTASKKKKTGNMYLSPNLNGLFVKHSTLLNGKD